MDNYLAYFLLLTLLRVNKIRATCVFDKSSLHKCTINWEQAAEKKESGYLNSPHQAKKQCNFDSGWLDRRQGSLLSFF